MSINPVFSTKLVLPVSETNHCCTLKTRRIALYVFSCLSASLSIGIVFSATYLSAGSVFFAIPFIALSFLCLKRAQCLIDYRDAQEMQKVREHVRNMDLLDAFSLHGPNLIAYDAYETEKMFQDLLFSRLHLWPTRNIVRFCNYIESSAQRYPHGNKYQIPPLPNRIIKKFLQELQSKKLLILHDEKVRRSEHLQYNFSDLHKWGFINEEVKNGLEGLRARYFQTLQMHKQLKQSLIGSEIDQAHLEWQSLVDQHKKRVREIEQELDALFRNSIFYT